MARYSTQPFPLSVRWMQVTGAAVMLMAALPGAAQVMTISNAPTGPSIDRRYMQIDATHVVLPQSRIDARGHQEILRTLLDEQGFAMRPLPRGKRGLSLEANGKLTPAGEGYLNEVTVYGLSVKAGDRIVFSNIKIEKNRMVFDINGGPQHKHEFMRHVQIGMGGPDMTSPVMQNDINDAEPTGARIALTFHDYVPDVTPAQIKALLAPLISFDMKTPAQAFTDTLPPLLKKAIMDHHVMVGMSTEMVLYSLGQPDAKSREMDGQMPFEEWIYGKPPQDVHFVRINGNRVIRVELAKLGQPLEISTKDEVQALMMTDGKPALAQVSPARTRTVQMGDAHRDPDTQSAGAAPSLRAPGENLPQDHDMNSHVGDPTVSREQTMGPVLFPKDTSNAPAHTLDVAAARRAAAAKDAQAKPQDGKDKNGSDEPGSGKPAAAPKSDAKPAQPASPALQATPPAGAPSQPAGQAPAPQPPPASNFLAEPAPASF